MSTSPLRVILGTSEHWLLADLPLADERIQDQLNDSRSDFVKLSQVEVHSCTEPERVANLLEVIVPKLKIEFVAAYPRQHEAPDKRLNNFASKGVFKTFAVLSRYRISGDLHLQEFSGDIVRTLTHQLSRFFPVTEAVLSGCGAKQICVPLLVANKDFVGCFHVGDGSQEEGSVGVLDHLKALGADVSIETA